MLRELPEISSSRYALALPRMKLQILTGLFTGHSDLMKINEDELCPLCQEEEHLYTFLRVVLQQRVPRETSLGHTRWITLNPVEYNGLLL